MLVLSPAECQNLLTSLLFWNLYTGWKWTNALNINSFLPLIRFSVNPPTSVSPRLDFCSTLSQHMFFIYGHSCSPTYPLLWKSHCCSRYAAPCLWNELPTDLREPRQIQSPALSPITHGSSSSSPSSLSLLASSFTCSVFHYELKTWLFSKFFPP